MYKYSWHFALQEKLTEHCKATIQNFKKKIQLFRDLWTCRIYVIRKQTLFILLHQHRMIFLAIVIIMECFLFFWKESKCLHSQWPLRISSSVRKHKDPDLADVGIFLLLHVHWARLTLDLFLDFRLTWWIWPPFQQIILMACRWVCNWFLSITIISHAGKCT